MSPDFDSLDSLSKAYKLVSEHISDQENDTEIYHDEALRVIRSSLVNHALDTGDKERFGVLVSSGWEKTIIQESETIELEAECFYQYVKNDFLDTKLKYEAIKMFKMLKDYED